MKKRTDYRLKDTEKLWDAVKKTNTQVKDYSLKHLVTVLWEPPSKTFKRTRLVQISIGDQTWFGRGAQISDRVNQLLEDNDERDHMWASKVWIKDYYTDKELIINTSGMNKEGLIDHIAEVSIGKNTAIIDLEELLKATRYG